jgi:DNA-binding HxlR family transcriptional regulator
MTRETRSEELPPHADGICVHFQRAADLLGKRWSTLIVSAMLAGATRFSDIRDEVAPISDTLLSERLKQLEADGIIRRDVTPSTPVLIEYHLTDEGRDLERVIDELRSWAERWAETPVAT